MRRMVLVCLCVLLVSARIICTQQPQNALNRWFVLDLTNDSQQVVLGTYGQAELSVTVMLKGVDFFRGSPDGYYVAHQTDGAWLVGNYRIQAPPTTLNPGVVPSNCVEASIAHTGKAIVWVTREEKRSRLILTDLVTSTSCQIRAKTGDLRCPSWSPDNRKIAYYSGVIHSVRSVDYSLCSLDIPGHDETAWADVEWFEKEIAPTSSPNVLYWPLSPPLWSPDGVRILFDACYTKKQPDVTHYIVKEDGTDLRPAPGDIPSAWTSDSKGIYTIFRRDGRYVPATVDLMTSAENRDRYLPYIPEGLLMFAWEPKGDFLITVSKSHVILLNMQTGQQRLLYQCTSTCSVIWGGPTNE